MEVSINGIRVDLDQWVAEQEAAFLELCGYSIANGDGYGDVIRVAVTPKVTAMLWGRDRARYRQLALQGRLGIVKVDFGIGGAGTCYSLADLRAEYGDPPSKFAPAASMIGNMGNTGKKFPGTNSFQPLVAHWVILHTTHARDAFGDLAFDFTRKESSNAQ